MQQNTTKNQAGERTHFNPREMFPPTPAKAPWTKTTIYRKGKVRYHVTRQHGSRNTFTGTIECPGLLFQRGLSLQAIEQLELLLLAEGYQKLP